MPRHKDLIGTELHNAKINLEAPNREPAYPGETVFDGKNLWISTDTTGNSWKLASSPPTIPAPPLLFSWALNLNVLFLPIGSAISLYYRSNAPRAANDPPAEWEVLMVYTSGAEIPLLELNGAIALNPWIERRGEGFYMPLLINADGTALQTKLSIRSIAPEGIARIQGVGRWVEPGTDRVYQNAEAFEVRQCMGAFVGDVLQFQPN